MVPLGRERTFRYAFGSGAATALGHDPIDGLDWAESTQRLLVCDHDAMRVRSVDPTSGAVFATFERDPDTAPE
ncbi:MAG: hypothetical protein U1F43_22880 [Myxococcota bacterium]